MHRDLYDERRRIVRTLDRIRATAEADVHPVTIAVHELEGEPVPFEEAVAGAFGPAAVGMSWGPPWSTVWFHLTGEVQRGRRQVHEHPDPVPQVVTEGYLSVRVPVYPIPFRALIPRHADCTNLLVPVCVSASHVAFSSIRMEPQYMMLGHAAGLAAAEASRRAVDVQSVDVPALQEDLTAAGQVLAAAR